MSDMDRSQIDANLQRIFSDIFDKPEGSFTYESSPDNIQKWDSLAQINIIAALEEEFGTDIPPEQQLEMLTFELIGDVMQDLV